jgi:hypothetical protein
MATSPVMGLTRWPYLSQVASGVAVRWPLPSEGEAGRLAKRTGPGRAMTLAAGSPQIGQAGNRTKSWVLAVQVRVSMLNSLPCRLWGAPARALATSTVAIWQAAPKEAGRAATAMGSGSIQPLRPRRNSWTCWFRRRRCWRQPKQAGNVGPGRASGGNKGPSQTSWPRGRKGIQARPSFRAAVAQGRRSPRR